MLPEESGNYGRVVCILTISFSMNPVVIPQKRSCYDYNKKRTLSAESSVPHPESMPGRCDHAKRL